MESANIPKKPRKRVQIYKLVYTSSSEDEDFGWDTGKASSSGSQSKGGRPVSSGSDSVKVEGEDDQKCTQKLKIVIFKIL